MANNNQTVINRSIRIYHNTGVLAVTKAFAENNLSKSALKYAEKTDTHYNFVWGKTSNIVVFELPKLFNIHFLETLRFLTNYCMPYMQENNLTDMVIYGKYTENMNKEIKQ